MRVYVNTGYLPVVRNANVATASSCRFRTTPMQTLPTALVLLLPSMAPHP